MQPPPTTAPRPARAAAARPAPRARSQARAARALSGINPLFYAAVRRATDRRKNAIPLTGVTAVAIATRMCRKVDVYAMSTLSGPPACYYYWYSKRGGGCTGGARSSDEWYHKRPGDAEFHDFRGNADALLQWNASGAIRIRV